MKSYDFSTPDLVEMSYLPNYSILPNHSIIIRRFSTYYSPLSLDQLISMIDWIPEKNPRYVFIDYSPDDIPPYTRDEIQERIDLFKSHFPNSRVILLTPQPDDYNTTQPDVLFYPYWFLNHPTEYPITIRKKRIGCLNRRNAAHRVWLMHNLLSQGLIDHERDIFSMRFVNVFDKKTKADLASWLPSISIEEQRFINRSYPESIATIPDDFPNDHSTQHPAWNTALAIVTETEVDHYCVITEKTIKAFLSRSCFMLYTGQEELDLLPKLGFELGTFEQHATEFNIDPILEMARKLDTESVALDYYHSKLDIINHNYDWFTTGGWFSKYQEKLKLFVE